MAVYVVACSCPMATTLRQKRMQFAKQTTFFIQLPIQMLITFLLSSPPGHPMRVQDATEFNDQNVDLYDDVITQSGKNTSSANNNSHHDDEYGANNREHSSSASNSNEFHSSHHHQHHQHHSTNEIQSNPSSNSSSTKKIGIYVGNLTWVCIST